MDKDKAINLSKNFLRTVNEHYPVEAAYLFGSYAKGTNHPDSDIDLAIVFSKVDDILQLQIALMRIREDKDLLIEPHPFSRSDFTNASPLAAEILQNGISLF